jgi:hypothetical protein
MVFREPNNAKCKIFLLAPEGYVEGEERPLLESTGNHISVRPTVTEVQPE